MPFTNSQPKIANKICKICKRKISLNPKKTEEDEWVQCDCCNGWYHLYCIKMEDMSDSDKKKNYFCPKCLNNSNFATEVNKLNTSRTNSLDTSKPEVWTDELIKQQMEIIWPYLRDDIEKTVDAKTQHLADQIAELRISVNRLETQLLRLQQQQNNSRSNNVVIRGVVENVDINNIDIIQIIAKKINFSLQKDDITSMKRVQPRAGGSNKLKPSTIIATFKTTNIRNNFLKCFFAAIKDKLNIDMSIIDAQSMNEEGKFNRIYVSEHLDRDTLHIYLLAKKLNKAGKISNVQLRNACVFVCVKKDDMPTHVMSCDQLETLKQ